MSNAEFAVHIIQPAEGALRELVVRCGTRAAANEELLSLTGIEDFFPDDESLTEMHRFEAMAHSEAGRRSDREWGDFQTPIALAKQVCAFLRGQGVAPNVVIEPTFGVGNFLVAALNTFPEAPLFYGVGIQARYIWHFKMARFAAALRGEKATTWIQLHHDSIFTHEFARKVKDAEDVLILGNPPWVTSAELGVLDSDNLPRKHNLKALNGLDALTGKSNFDLNESILLRMLEVFGARRGTLALLCKNSVIKNWMEHLPHLPYKAGEVQALEIEAQRHFDAAVAASLLFVRFGGSRRVVQCRVASLDKPEVAQRTFGWQGNSFVSDVERYQKWAALDGACPFLWRQGLKHDCAAVMELTPDGDGLVNGAGEKVEVEPDYVFPLLKSSDLRAVKAPTPRKWVLVTQRRIGDETNHLRHSAPALWDYLSRHRTLLDARKSSIYRGKAPFSIFGVGDYSFKPYKVAISGFYKKPKFAFIEPVAGQPVMLDDTCYFLGLDSRSTALLVVFLLNSVPVLEFLDSIAFADAKRPFTKELLMRLNLNAAFAHQTAEEFKQFWQVRGEQVEDTLFDAALFNLPMLQDRPEQLLLIV